MGCTAGQCCCHFLGVLATLLGTVGVIGGLVLLIMFDKGTTYYWIAIGGLCGGALFAILLITYTCFVGRHNWKLYGCITIKQSQKKLTRRLQIGQMMPSKEEVERSDLEVNNGYVTSGGDDDLDNNNRNSKVSIGLDWDPETVLPD